MSRIVWKGPFIDEKIYYNIIEKKNTLICSRNLIITPNLIGLNLFVHNGKNLLKIKIIEDMIGHKFGEFSFTKKKFSFKKKKNKMGQKINPYLFRLGFKDNLWNSNYINYNFEELSLFVYQDIQIKNYIYKFFKQNKIFLHFCKIFRSQTELFIFISFYVSSKSINFITQINLIQKIYLNILNKKNLKKKKLIRRLWVIFLLKKKINTKENSYKNFDFIEQLLECLSIFTKKNLDINIILQQINNKNLFLRFYHKTKFLKSIIIKLRKYSNSLFFKESLNILSIVITKKNSAKLIAEFLAFQFSVIKKHNYFLNFLKRALILLVTSNFSSIQGLKILIKGRLNGKLRAKSRLLLIGKIPLQTINSKISYSTSVSYSLYGTFGFKIWICEK